MSESRLYPMVYQQFPDVVALEQIKDLDFGLDQTLPTIEELQGLGLGNRGDGLIESGILENLMNIVRDSEQEWMMIQRPEWTDDIVQNKRIQADIDDYWENRIKNQATNICDHIDGLIQLDKYPSGMFGAYKKLHRIVDSSTSKNEMARALNMLRITARSIVPPHLKYENVQIIEPSILSPSRTEEG